MMITRRRYLLTYLPTYLGGRPFRLHQALSGLHCGGRLWESGLTLTRFLEQERGISLRSFKGQRILELGAGLGACGLVCAIAGQCQEIVLTDQAEVLPHLKKNVRLLDSKSITPHIYE